MTKEATSHFRRPSTFAQKINDRFRPPEGKPTGYGLGWEKTAIIRVNPGEMSLWSGFNGHGKSCMLNQVMLHGATEGQKCVLASFEMSGDRNLMRLIRQRTGKVLPSEAEVKTGLSWFDKWLTIYSYLGGHAVDTMLSEFKRAAQNGCNVFVVDSLMKLGVAEDDFAGQKLAVEKLHNFCLESDVHVHLVAHSKKAEDESKVPGKMDVMGAGGISNIPDNGFTVWRNKAKEDHIEESYVNGTEPKIDILKKPDALLNCWKSRDHGSDAEKKYAFWYDKRGMLYKESQGQTYYEDLPY